MSRLEVLLAVLPVLHVAACGEDRAEVSNAPVILENPGELWTSQTEWRVAPEPRLTIGEGDDPTFDFAEISTLALTSEGNIAIGDQGNSQVVMLDENGRLVWVVGGYGQGPGEFGAIGMVKECPRGVILVHDPRLARLTLVNSDGSLLKTLAFRKTRTGTPPYGLDCNTSGEMLTIAWPLLPLEPLPVGPYRPYVNLEHSKPGKLLGTPIGELPGDERYAYPRASGLRPLGRRTSVAIGRQEIFVVTGDAFEVAAIGKDGGRRRLFRTSRTLQRIGPVDVDKYIEQAVLTSPREATREWRRRMYRELTYPPTFPAFDQVLLDTYEDVWARVYTQPGQGSEEWVVFTNHGRLLGSIFMPAEFNLRAIGVDYVAGVNIGPLGRQSVRTYSLVKPAANATH